MTMHLHENRHLPLKSCQNFKLTANVMVFTGFGTVFMSLEGAAKVLGKNLANETVSVVSHK